MFFRTKTSGTRSYLQIVENRWEDGRPRQRVIATLGRLDRLQQTGQLDALLVSGALSADALAERLGIDLPQAREFATAAGYVLYMLKKLPELGEHFTNQGWRFEVIDLDGSKIDKILVSEEG